jgi:signal transduction histidine kinase
VRRHAAARTVAVTLAYRDDGRVHLRVEDDGQGAATLTGGFGLVGIRERAEQLGGSVAYRSAPGEGFTLDMELPA